MPAQVPGEEDEDVAVPRDAGAVGEVTRTPTDRHIVVTNHLLPLFPLPEKSGDEADVERGGHVYRGGVVVGDKLPPRQRCVRLLGVGLQATEY